MALRLIELFLPEKSAGSVEKLLDEKQLLGIWRERLDTEQVLVRVLLRTEDTEAVMDRFDKHFSTAEGFRLMLLPVEATLPRPEVPEEPKEEEVEGGRQGEEGYAHLTPYVVPAFVGSRRRDLIVTKKIKIITAPS
jgi:hypothetical protein